MQQQFLPPCFSIDRTTDEMITLIEWAEQHCAGEIYHEDIYAMGVLTTLKYLLNANNISPEDYYEIYKLGEIVKLPSKFEDGAQLIDKPIFDKFPEIAPDKVCVQPKLLFDWDQAPERKCFIFM